LHELTKLINDFLILVYPCFSSKCFLTEKIHIFVVFFNRRFVALDRRFSINNILPLGRQQTIVIILEKNWSW